MPRPKIYLRVSYNGIILGFQPKDTGSTPVTRSNLFMTFQYKLSNLQKYILLNCYRKKGNILERRQIFNFYNPKVIKRKSKKYNSIQTVITLSIRRLIKRDLIQGLGYATSKEFIIQKVKLTLQGKRYIKHLLSIKPLPFPKAS